MLNREEIEELIKEKDLVKNFPHMETQITQNGFDFTVEKIFKFNGKGYLDFSNSEREIPEGKEIKPEKKNPDDKYGWWKLGRGAYKIRTNEIVKLPNDLMAISFPRSSLLRMGAFTQHAAWEAGFEGKSEFILVVENTNGIEVKENARINQMIFVSMNETKEGYDGIYKGLS
ncbi:MAG: deoxyuridine 5'-triphosphate nucleotidohydrolase [Candidatus Aenigmatarchaeota archaeon]